MSTKPKVERDLDEFQPDPDFQRKFWVAERIAWMGFVLLIVLALAGLTGSGGPLAQATFGTPAGSVEYPRVSRWQAADSMTVRFAAGAEVGTVNLEPEFLRTFEVSSIQPEPRSAATGPEGVRYEFDAAGGGEVVFYIRARGPAFLPDASVRIGAFEAPVRPLVLP